jgi:hypothetical protein
MATKSYGKDNKPMVVVVLVDMCTQSKEQRKMSAFANK